MRRRSEPANPASRNAQLPPMPALSQESGLGRRPEVPAGQLAGPGRHRGLPEQNLIVPAEPPGAPGMVLIPAIGQRIQDGGVNDDHELNGLPAEALSKQLIGSLGRSGPPAFLSSWLRRGPGTHGLPKGIPGPAGRVSRERRWLSCPHPFRQPLDPTGALMTHTNSFLIMPSSWRAPLRNRTVHLLLTMHADFV
jgi:hypothetical protein